MWVGGGECHTLSLCATYKETEVQGAGAAAMSHRGLRPRARAWGTASSRPFQVFGGEAGAAQAAGFTQDLLWGQKRRPCGPDVGGRLTWTGARETDVFRVERSIPQHGACCLPGAGLLEHGRAPGVLLAPEGSVG